MSDPIATEQITDEQMQQRVAELKPYALMVLRPTPKLREPGAEQVVWEHGRRNMALQALGLMPIVCPVGDERIAGIGIFNTSVEEAEAIMRDDPGVLAGLFTLEVHACRGFPGDLLPL